MLRQCACRMLLATIAVLSNLGLPSYLTSQGTFREAQNFQESMTLVGVMSLDGGKTYASQGIITASVGNEMRGAVVAGNAVPFGPFQGKHTFDLMIFARSSDDGEVVNFAYHDEHGKRTTPLAQTVPFVKDGRHGSHVEPFLFTPAASEASAGGTSCLACHLTVLELSRQVARAGLPAANSSASEIYDVVGAPERVCRPETLRSYAIPSTVDVGTVAKWCEGALLEWKTSTQVTAALVESKSQRAAARSCPRDIPMHACRMPSAYYTCMHAACILSAHRLLRGSVHATRLGQKASLIHRHGHGHMDVEATVLAICCVWRTQVKTTAVAIRRGGSGCATC